MPGSKVAPPMATSPVADKDAAKPASRDEFKELHLPLPEQQPFQHELGVENLPPASSRDESYHFVPPEKPAAGSIATAPLQTAEYQVLRSENVDGNATIAREFVYTDNPETKFITDGNIAVSELEHFQLKVEATQNLLEAQEATSFPELARVSSPDYLSFTLPSESGPDSRLMLASARFLLEETDSEAIESPVKARIEALDASLSELQTDFDSYELKSRDAVRDRRAELHSAYRKLLFPKDSEGRSRPRTPEEEKQISEIDVERRRLEEQSYIGREMSELAEQKARLEAVLSDATCYKGVLADGRQVVAHESLDPTMKLEFYDAAGDLIATESRSNLIHTRGGGPFLDTHIHTLFSEGLEREQTFGKLGTADAGRTITRNADGSKLLTEDRDVNGDLLFREDHHLGLRSEYESGTLSAVSVIDILAVAENLTEAAAEPGFEEALREFAASNAEKFLQTYPDLAELPAAQVLLEIAVANLPSEKIAEFQESVRVFQEEGKQDWKLQKYEGEQLDTLKSLLDFRGRMLSESVELVRGSEHVGELHAVALWNDPNSRGYFSIDPRWIDPQETGLDAVPAEQRNLLEKDMRLLVARRLAFTDREINETSVREAVSEVMRLRTKHQDIELLSGRNVVIAAHSQTLLDWQSYLRYEALDSGAEYNTFGGDNLRRGIEAQQGPDTSLVLHRAAFDNLGDVPLAERLIAEVSTDDEQRKKNLDDLRALLSDGKPVNLLQLRRILRDNGTPDEQSDDLIDSLRGSPGQRVAQLEAVKRDALKSIVELPSPLTLIFSGHGGPDALYLSDGFIGSDDAPVEYQTTVKLTPEDLAGAFQRRAERLGAEEPPPAVILDGCYNANFTRRFAAALGETPAPVVVGASEFNQYSLFNFNYGSTFLSDVVGANPQNPAARSNLGSVIERQLMEQEVGEPDDTGKRSTLNTNPGIYVPDEDGGLIQIGARLVSAYPKV